MTAMRIGVLVLLVSTAAWAQAVNVPFTSETLAIPGNQAGDTAILRDPWNEWRDTVFGTDALNNGFYGFLVDGGGTFTARFGPVGGVDARQPLAALPETSVGGLVVVSATNAGEVLFFTTSDGGLLSTGGLARISTLGPRAVALGDFGDAGAFVFLSTQAPMMPWWRLTEDGGTIVTTPQSALSLPGPPTALATASATRLVYASVGVGGVVEIDPLAEPPTVIQVIDAGSPNEIVGGLATYPQRDGGSLLVTSVPAKHLFRVYAARVGEPAQHLTDFTVSGVDGGRKILAASSFDVWPGAFGVTSEGPVYDAGVIVICDISGATGANYKLVSWAALARAVTPPLPIDLPDFVAPPVEVRPVGVPAQLSVATSTSVLDLSFWPGNDTLVATLDGVSLLSPRDLRPLNGTDGGARDAGVADAGRADAGVADGGRADAGPIDAGPPAIAVSVSTLGQLSALSSLAPAGVLAVASNSGPVGSVSVWSKTSDGGLSLLLTIPTSASTSIQLADLADAGVWLFSAAGTDLRRFELAVVDGGLRATPGLPISLSETISSLVSWPSARHLFVSTNRAVFEVDPLETPPSTRLFVDAGASALTVYQQRDGGAMLLGATHDRVRVMRANDGASLLEFQVIGVDRISLVAGIGWLDVSREGVGLSADGGPRDAGLRWPSGALAIGTDGGSIVIVDWAQLARSVSPALPIDPASAGSAGGTGGGAGGGRVVTGGGSSNRAGGSAGGGTAGGGEEPPPGCCSGAPSSSVLPAMAFLLWLRRFARRRTN